MKHPEQPSKIRAEHIRAETRHEEIARRAYELWEQTGCQNGSAEANWQEAEQQLLGRSSLLQLPS